MKIVNLTPHAISLQVGDRTTIFHPSGTVARVSQVCVPTRDEIRGALVYSSTFGEVDMPGKESSTVYIVSGMVLTALAGCRSDVIAPKTDSTAIRNDQGQIVAVTGWLQ